MFNIHAKKNLFHTNSTGNGKFRRVLPLKNQTFQSTIFQNTPFVFFNLCLLLGCHTPLHLFVFPALPPVSSDETAKTGRNVIEWHPWCNNFFVTFAREIMGMRTGRLCSRNWTPFFSWERIRMFYWMFSYSVPIFTEWTNIIFSLLNRYFLKKIVSLLQLLSLINRFHTWRFFFYPTKSTVLIDARITLMRFFLLGYLSFLFLKYIWLRRFIWKYIWLSVTICNMGGGFQKCFITYGQPLNVYFMLCIFMTNASYIFAFALL